MEEARPEVDEVRAIARGIATAVAPEGGLTEVQVSLLRAVTLGVTGHDLDYHALEPLEAEELKQVLAGRAYSLREVCSRSLKNLDFCASMQAYTFLRFLFLFDPATAQRLPPALRAQAAGPQAERADRALREVFGQGLADLERFWRAFVVEIE